MHGSHPDRVSGLTHHRSDATIPVQVNTSFIWRRCDEIDLVRNYCSDLCANGDGAIVDADGGPRHRQGRHDLRLPARRQLSHPVFVFRRQERPGVQGRLERALQHRARLHARRQGDPDAQFGHALFLRRRRSARRAAGASRCRRSRRSATTRCSSSTCTRSTSPMSAAAPPATTPASYLLAGPDWKGETPEGHQGGDPLRNGVRVRPLSHPALQSGRHRERQEDPGRLQGRSRCRPSLASRRRRPRRRSISSSRSAPRAGEDVARRSSTS